MEKRKDEDLTPEELEFKFHKEGLWDTEEEELKKHIAFFEEKAKKDGKACFTLATYYLFGAQDYKNGLFYANQGTNNGNDDCYGLIAKCYEKGLGVRQDMKKAVYIYELLAGENNIFGTYALADCYFFGKGVKKDQQKAFDLFADLATNKDYTKAKYKLGIMYEKGFGTKKDYKKAMYWYEKSIKDGFQKAYCNLGGIYLNGTGTAVDKEKAVEYFSLGAENNDPRSLFMLAKCYYRGLGTQKNVNKAINLLEEADAKGDKYARDYMINVIGFEEKQSLDKKEWKNSFSRD